MGMDVCLRACGSASAVLAIPHSRDLYITVKLLIIIFNQTCSCCQLFALKDWNVTNTTSSAHFYVTGE